MHDHELIFILLYESDKLIKTKLFFLGIVHGLIGRMGNLSSRDVID